MINSPIKSHFYCQDFSGIKSSKCLPFSGEEQKLGLTVFRIKTLLVFSKLLIKISEDQNLHGIWIVWVKKVRGSKLQRNLNFTDSEFMGLKNSWMIFLGSLRQTSQVKLLKPSATGISGGLRWEEYNKVIMNYVNNYYTLTIIKRHYIISNLNQSSENHITLAIL